MRKELRTKRKELRTKREGGSENGGSGVGCCSSSQAARNPEAQHVAVLFKVLPPLRPCEAARSSKALRYSKALRRSLTCAAPSLAPPLEKPLAFPGGSLSFQVWSRAVTADTPFLAGPRCPRATWTPLLSVANSYAPAPRTSSQQGATLKAVPQHLTATCVPSIETADH